MQRTSIAKAVVAMGCGSSKATAVVPAAPKSKQERIQEQYRQQLGAEFVRRFSESSLKIDQRRASSSGHLALERSASRKSSQYATDGPSSSPLLSRTRVSDLGGGSPVVSDRKSLGTHSFDRRPSSNSLNPKSPLPKSPLPRQNSIPKRDHGAVAASESSEMQNPISVFSEDANLKEMQPDVVADQIGGVYDVPEVHDSEKPA